MLSPSSCHSCVWIQASPLNFTNVAASTVQLALSLSRAPHTQCIYLYGICPCSGLPYFSPLRKGLSFCPHPQANTPGQTPLGQTPPMSRHPSSKSILSTRTSSEFVYEFSENKVQLVRIMYKNGKFHSILPDCPNSIPYSTF